ncbi:MAG: hypothetical protein IKL53_02200 [Lachnospiraceae bacterium]|nr:hypothetical protein [Lachnospiraceae bacterium]
MSLWIEHESDEFIPNWLKVGLPTKCRYCGSPMLNYYNDDYRCTNRKCSNDKCYGFVAARADFARKLLGIEGVGFAGCLRDAQMFKADSPFVLLKAWGINPVVSLDQYLRIHCFEGIDSEWERIVNSLGVYTLDELYEQYDGKWRNLLLENKELLYNNLQYVTLKQRPSYMKNSNGPQLTYTIMITGTPIGFDTKEHFINSVNEACMGRIIVLHQKTKKQSGVDFLIREPGSTTRGKVDAANRAGIPIVTSQQFIAYLTSKLLELNAET